MFAVCTISFLFTGVALSGETDLRESVVKIYITAQRPDYSMPWQSLPPGNGSGSGFIINKRRILTNAHVVSDIRFLQVQKDGDARRYPAKVAFIGHDCDLAVLTVEDPTFFEGTKAVRFSDSLPALNNEVTVLGYPTGGARLSITRGVVSRIDYSIYTHSGADQHLVLQVDAAINPGNSGGPIVFKNKVAGLAFQGLMFAENIGYGIPVPVIQHFLDDISDNKYDGYPELGAAYLETTNPALCRDLGMPPNKTGIVVYYLDPFGSAIGCLKPRDVLFSIDGYKIESDGTVLLNDNNVPFAELLERKQCGQSVVFKVWRDNTEIEVNVPLKISADPFAYRNIYDKLPEYYIFAGLIFSPLNRECLRAANRHSHDRNVNQLNYYSQYAKIDNLNKDRDEFVVLVRQLPHPVNTYTQSFLNGIVTAVNGINIRNLHDLKTAMTKPLNGFHVIKFAGMDDSLILDAVATVKANEEILLRYGVPSPEYFEIVK
ncbi:MAG: trypsin-like peptidase domain-containing protein [Kiritimatiellae bacterium]|nr:trypsin-like peptidase domain-containing protein [Kiritimatiellia bacterium]